MANQGKRMVKENLISNTATIDYVDDSVTGLVAQSEMEEYVGDALEDYTPTANLATVATTGDYDDLSDKPDLSIYAESADLATVATTGAYSDLTGTPTIPDAVSGLNDGTNWTSLTIGENTYGVGGGSTPSNMVTTDTNQNITGRKNFNIIENANFAASSNNVNFGYVNSTYATEDPKLNFKIYNRYSGSKNNAAHFSFMSSNPNSAGGASPSFDERAYLKVFGSGGIQIRNDVSGANSDANITIANKAGNGLYFYSTVTRFRTISGNLLVVPDEAGTLVTSNKVPDAPTTDGTYVLKATVSNGTVTYA